MDVKQLRYFLGVFDAKSITKAADQLFVAQPALGLQVRKLEEELGIELFSRHSRGVTPTAAGNRLANRARVLLSQFERVKQDILDFAEEPHGRVVIGMTPTTILVLAAAVADRCREAYPEITLNILEGLSERLMEWVDNGQIDITLTYNPEAVKGLICKPLITEELYFVERGKRRKKSDETLSFPDVIKNELVLPSRLSLLRQIVEEAAEKTGSQPNVTFNVDSVPAIKEMVKRGLGGTILPYGAIQEEVEAGSLRAKRIEDPELYRTLYLASSSKRPESKAIVVVSRLIEEVASGLARSGYVGWQLVSENAD